MLRFVMMFAWVPTLSVAVTRDGYDWIAYGASLLLVLAGVVGVCVGIRTLRFLKIQTMATKDAADAALWNAKAAEISAKAAMGVAIPTMKLTGFAFIAPTGGAIDAKVFFTRPRVSITATNFGQSPAFLKGYSIVFTCNELPDEPVYPFPYTCDAEDVVDSGKTFSPGVDTLTLINPMPDADIEALVARDKRLTVYGYISYGDVFGSPVRYMKFCKRLG